MEAAKISEAWARGQTIVEFVVGPMQVITIKRDGNTLVKHHSCHYYSKHTLITEADLTRLQDYMRKVGC